MKKKLKIRKVLAFIFVLLGILILTFPFVKRSVNYIQREKGYREFIKEDFSSLDQKAIDYNKKIKDSQTAMVDPFSGKNFESESILNDKDQVFAYIRIPKLGRTFPIYLDASLYHLSIGVAQISGTDIPIGGVGNRSVIAGHRGWWGDNMFLYVNDLVEGDSIFIDRNGKSLEYKVYNKEVIGVYDWDKLKPIAGEDIVTLLTCHPIGLSAPNRLLINAKRVNENKSVDEIKEHEKNDVSNKAKFVNCTQFILSLIGIVAFLIVLRRFIRYVLKGQ